MHHFLSSMCMVIFVHACGIFHVLLPLDSELKKIEIHHIFWVSSSHILPTRPLLACLS